MCSSRDGKQCWLVVGLRKQWNSIRQMMSNIPCGTWENKYRAAMDPPPSSYQVMPCHAPLAKASCMESRKALTRGNTCETLAHTHTRASNPAWPSRGCMATLASDNYLHGGRPGYTEHLNMKKMSFD